MPFFRPFRKQIIGILLFVPFIAFLQGAQPYLLKKTVDEYAHSNLNHAWPQLLGITLIVLIILRIWQNIIVQAIGQKLVSDIREQLFRHLQNLSIDFFEKNQTGKLLTRLTNDIEALSEMFASGLVGGANDLFSLIGIATFMLFLEPKFTLAQLALIPVLLLLTNLFEKFYREANAASRKELAQINSLFQESLLGLMIIKIFNRSGFLKERFAQTSDNYIKATNNSITADSAYSALIELIGILGIILVIVVAAFILNETTIGNLVAFVNYSQMLFGPIRSLSEKFSTFQSGFTAAERIVSVLEEKPSVQIENADLEHTESNIKQFDLEMKNVSFKYNLQAEQNVLSNISFKLPAGESLGIVGQTGSGKSTLIKLLCRFYDPVSGEILIGGQNLRQINPSELRKEMLMIPQRSFLFSGSIYDNLVLDKKIAPALVEKIAEEIGLFEAINNLPNGLQAQLNERGLDLSSGQKQLISLTRALVQEPQILILDEATASLDPYTEGLVTNAIKKILNSGKTVIFIAHRMNLVAECKQIMVLQNGIIKELGIHNELMNQNGYYAHLVSLSTLI